MSGFEANCHVDVVGRKKERDSAGKVLRISVQLYMSFGCSCLEILSSDWEGKELYLSV